MISLTQQSGRPTPNDCKLFALAGTLICAPSSLLVTWGSTIWQLLGAVAITALPLSMPFVVMGLASRGARLVLTRTVYVVAMAAAVVWWYYWFYDLFFTGRKPDALDGILFLFAPLYSAGACLGLALIGNVVDSWAAGAK